MLLWLALALPALAWSDPACWEASETLSFGVRLSGVPHPGGLPIYLEGEVLLPRFHEQGAELWLGDSNQLLHYVQPIDQFEPVWKSTEGHGIFTFTGRSFVWLAAGASPETSRGRELGVGTAETLTLLQFPLDAPEPRAHPLTPATLDAAGDGRWFRPVALIRGTADAESERIYLVIERQPTEERLDESVVYEITLSEAGARVHAAWTLDGIYSRYVLAPEPIGGHDVLLMISHSDKLFGLPLDRAMAGPDIIQPRAVLEDDLTALAEPGAGSAIVVANGAGCITWSTLREEAGALALAPQHSYCASAPGSAPTADIRELSVLNDGRVLVQTGPDRLRPQADTPRLNSFYLPPPGEVGWGPAPLPVGLRETASLFDARDTSWRLTSAYSDAFGRLWATARNVIDSRVRVQRLDTPFQPLDLLLGAPVADALPFGEVFAVLTTSPERGQALLALTPFPLRVEPLAELGPDAVVGLAAGAEGLYALTTGAGGASLMRWRSAGAPAERLALPARPAPPTAFWVGEGRVFIRFGQDPPEEFTVGPDDQLLATGALGPACRAPRTLPSVLEGALVCGDDLSRWTHQDRPVLPIASGGWALVSDGGDNSLSVRTLGGDGAKSSFRLPGGESRTPLVLARDPAGTLWLYTLREHRLERITGDNPPEAVADRGERRDQRDQPTACRRAFDLAERGALTPDFSRDGTLLLRLEDPGGGRTFLLGPVLPFSPELRADFTPFGPARHRLRQPESQDPRLTLTSSCAPGATTALSSDLVVSPPWRPRLSTDCQITVRNGYGSTVTSTQRFYDARNGVGGALAGLALLGGGLWTVLARRRKERAAIRHFAEQAKSPYVVGPPVRGAMFYGRERLLDELVQAVRAGGFFALIADEKRMGKTSLLLKVQEKLAETPPGANTCRAVYFSMERANGGKTFFRELWRPLSRIAREQALADTLPFPDPHTEHEAFSNFSHLLDGLHAQGSPTTIVLLIDEVQMLAGSQVGPDAQEAAQKLRSLTAEVSRDRLGWLAAGVAEMLKPTNRNTDSDLLLIGPRYSLGGLAPDTALRLVREPIAGLPISFSPEAEQQIVRYSKGHPFVIQYTCRTLFTNASLDLVGGGRLHRAVIGIEAVQAFTRDNPVAHLIEADTGE